jgi:hypothetical protein
LEEVPSLQVTSVAAVLLAAAAGAVLAAGAAAGAGAAGGVELAETGAVLFTPPWPLQAPRPPWDELPSLHVTVLALLLVLAGAAAGAVLAAGADGALVAGLGEAALLMPPCPLQAPRPPLDIEPSLQTTWGVSWARAIVLIASSDAVRTAPHATVL